MSSFSFSSGLGVVHEAPAASLLDGMADMAYMKDLDGRYLLINQAGARLLGKSVAEIVGRDDSTLFPAEIARMHADQDRATLASGGALTFEEEIRAGGRTILLQTVKSVCRDATGAVVGLAGIARDMSERKHLEAALRERERELREAQRIAGLGTWRYDCKTGVTTWSDEIYRIYGLEPSQNPEPYAECHARPDQSSSGKKFLEAFDRAIQFGKPYSMDLELTHRDGTKRWILTTGEVDRWEHGKVASLRGTVQEITERKRNERELALRENRYRSLVHATAQIVWSTNAAGDQIGIMPQWQAFTGQSDQEVLGYGWAAAVHPDDRERTVNAWRDSVQSGATHTMEHRLRRADGVYRDMAVRAVPVRDEEGQIVEWVGTHTDITDQKQAERERNIALQRLQNILDSVTDGLCVLDRDLTYLYFNESGARMVGLRSADIVGTRVGDTFAENKTNLIQRSYRRAIETGKPIHIEEYSFAPLHKWFESNCYPSAEGLTVYFRDISERKRTEAELREREQRFRLLAESLPELVWITDAVGSLSYLNSRFLNYCGIPPEEMTGFDWQKILHPEEIERVNQAWTHSVQTGEPYRSELQMRRHDGAFRYFLARALPMRNEAGEIEQWVGSCADIHDQRLAEEALRRSEKLAATGRLAASIAHEINNPLAAVTNVLYLALQDPTLQPQTREMLRTADEELARVSQITTQTLRFHRQSKAAARADLSEIMHSVLTLFRRRMDSRQIQIVDQCTPGTRILCLEDEMRQVFTNLVSNALDAIPGNGKIWVRIRASHSNGTAGVRVTVADTGCGIPPEIRDRVFEPFFSTKDSTGIGLGLWVSEGILRKHSARIQIRSATAPQRHGTVFSLFFPENGIR